MIRAAAKTAAALQAQGLEHNRIKINLYPDRRIRDVVSLRLFGTEHAKNRVFSQVWTPAGLLDEAASWIRFPRTILEARPLASKRLGKPTPPWCHQFPEWGWPTLRKNAHPHNTDFVCAARVLLKCNVIRDKCSRCV